MHLCGPSVHVDNLSSNGAQLRLYPCLNFTCYGKIVKLMFIAPVETYRTVTVRWPEFGLWSECNHSWGEGCDWIEVQRLSVSQQPCLVCMNESQTVGVYEIEFTSNNTFEHGNFLRILCPMATCKRLECYECVVPKCMSNPPQPTLQNQPLLYIKYNIL